MTASAEALDGKQTSAPQEGLSSRSAEARARAQRPRPFCYHQASLSRLLEGQPEVREGPRCWAGGIVWG